MIARGRARRTLLGSSAFVSSIHHQAIDETGPCWRVTARTADGGVEACEWAGPRPWPVLAVQWHPERDRTGPALFGWLMREAVSAARRTPRSRPAPAAAHPC